MLYGLICKFWPQSVLSLAEKKARGKKCLQQFYLELHDSKSFKDEARFQTSEQNLPAGGRDNSLRVWISLALVFEVCDVENGEGTVDVAFHGVMGVVPIGGDREGPVIHQPGDHVWRESNDHGLYGEENKKGALI